MFAATPSFPEKTLEKIRKIETPPLKSGLYQSDTNYFWVAKKNWITADGKPFAMSCYESQDKLNCKTTYRITGEIFANYDFRVNKDTAIKDARKAYDAANLIIKELISAPFPPPTDTQPQVP